MASTWTPWGFWNPVCPAEVARLFGGSAVPWWLAGGYAIECAVGRAVHEHVDIDVLVLRRDQLRAQDAPAGWQCWAADPPGTLRPWRPGELLPPSVQVIWCRQGDGPWRHQLMLEESVGDRWVSRRDARVHHPIAALGRTNEEGVPFRTPEIPLFSKAEAPRQRDEVDMTAVLPLFSGEQRRWLARAIELAYGPHPWLPRLVA